LISGIGVAGPTLAYWHLRLFATRRYFGDFDGVFRLAAEAGTYG